MIDIEDTEKKVKQVDSLLTTITNVLKKHWLVLIFLSILGIGYWAFNLPDTPVEEPVQEEYVEEEYVEDEYVEQDSSYDQSEPYVEQN